MKFLVTFLIAFLVSTISFADIGPVASSTSLNNAGVLNAGSLEKYFIKVKNQSGGALENGDCVVWDFANDDGYSVTTSTTAGAVPACVLAEACADDALCKCQTYGLHTAVNFDSTNDAASAGDNLFISESTAGKCESEALGTIAASDNPIGMIYDDASASADVEVFVRLR